jgi:hypothetical protein
MTATRRRVRRMVKQVLRYVERAGGGKPRRQAPDDAPDHSRRADRKRQSGEHEELPKLAVRGERSSLEHECWLAHCHGFLVDTLAGEEVGVVDDVETDASTGLATALDVSAGWFGRHRLTVPVAHVRRILPGERRIYIEGRPERAEGSGDRRR